MASPIGPCTKLATHTGVQRLLWLTDLISLASTQECFNYPVAFALHRRGIIECQTTRQARSTCPPTDLLLSFLFLQINPTLMKKI